MKEKNNMELIHILRVYLGRVITLAFVNADTYQLLMLCADHQGILELMFHFCQSSGSEYCSRPMENWLTKCLGAKIITDESEK